MRILSAIVEAPTDLVAIGGANFFHCGAVRPKPVGDDALRSAVLLHDPLEKLQRRGLVPPRGDHSLQHLAFMVDGAPKIAELAVDFHKHLIQVPAPLRIGAHVRDSSLANLGGEHWAKPVPQNRTVPWLISMPRSASKSSTLRSDRGNRTYII